MDSRLGTYLSSMTINVSLAVGLFLLLGMAFGACLAAYFISLMHLPRPRSSRASRDAGTT